MAELFYQYQIEHIFAQELYDEEDTNRTPILESAGYAKDMAGNKIALFTDPEVVAQLQSAPDTHPLKQLLAAAGFGPVRHGGSQFGKNDFQKRIVDDWINGDTILI